MASQRRWTATGPRPFLALIAVCAFLAALPAEGQTYEVVHAFDLPPGVPASSLIQASDGNFYGTTFRGGRSDKGTVFSVTPGGALRTLHSFAGIDWSTGPGGLVEAPDGSLYGTTGSGGPANMGTIYRITLSGTLTTLYSFSGSDGFHPSGPLVWGSDGALYGLTARGGTNDEGTIFRVTTTGALTTLHVFTGSDGISPNGGLVLASDGQFYGTTFSGGASDYGTVFRMTPAGVVTTIHSFSFDEGTYPRGGFIQATDGNLYGTASDWGPNGYGTVFRISPAGDFTVLYSFDNNEQGPWAGLVQGTDGDLYGMTLAIVFRVSTSGALTALHLFDYSTDGSGPVAGLVQGSDGDFFGTTSSGGMRNVGTVFRITPAGSFTTLTSFTSEEGLAPGAALVPGLGGDLYGTTLKGGPFDKGTVFKVTLAGAETTLHAFSGADGASPHAGLVLGSDGKFRGTTTWGGTADQGTVFEMTPAGALTVRHSFSGTDGFDPWGALIQATDGAYYGTTSNNGNSGGKYGTIFKIDATGVFTSLRSFSPSDPNNPFCGLVQASDGNFYGTTINGGSSGNGTIYRFTPGGTLNTLYSFPIDGSAGANPVAALLQAADGNLYGMTKDPFAPSKGTVFRIDLAGNLTTLHLFNGADGSSPQDQLVEWGGDLFGTTPRGGSNNLGTLFKITTTGTLTTLGSFFGVEGDGPGGLARAPDGYLYGVAAGGGPGSGGVVFRLNPSGPPTPRALVSGGGTSCAGAPVSLQAVLTGTPPWTIAWSDGLIQDGLTTTPVTRSVSPASTTLYTLTSVADLNGPGFVGGSASVAAAAPLSGVTASAPGSPPACIGAPNGVFWASDTGGGAATYQWGYRTTPGGPITPISGQISSHYHGTPSQYPGYGTYRVVATATPACGSPMVSNEVLATIVPPPVVAAPTVVGAGSPNRIASVPQHAGSTYSWYIENGTITGGQGTSQITFTAGATGYVYLFVWETTSTGCQSDVGRGYNIQVIPAGSAVQFYTVPPCRQLDTRSSVPIASHGTLTIALTGAPCGIPAGATSVSVNVAETQAGGLGHLRIYPADGTMPQTSSLNFNTGQTRSSNAILKLSNDGTGSVAVYNGSGGTVHVILDVNGYFQ